MSTSYVAVGWNRQKKKYDLLIAGLSIAYLLVFAGLTSIYNPQYTFETLLIRAAGTLALLLLHIILAIGPLTRLNNKYMPLLYNRRHLGVTMFVVALVHGGFSLLQFHALGNQNPFVSLFTSNTQYNSIAQFPFQSLGFFALLILLLMATTSHDFWLHNLSPKTWKTLHMAVYFAYLLIILHVMLGVVQYETHPVLVIMLALGAATLITLHLLAGSREVKRDQQQYNVEEQGFFYVCNSNEFEESRAKIFCIGKERIAVYKHEGRLYAINNVCKHQGGPLGEGKIIDGCITCPWHGYQYLPGNGQSPPPFKEKVSTYDLRVAEGKVWLHPSPLPEGTARPGVAC
ncbi:MAG TPA: Rieske 2Fe-2S domain-containing protein [Chitinophagaceae bacterium]|nr:Rieske 2Fe-2S domain-containing protein [Chitinophagaceae bacterium]